MRKTIILVFQGFKDARNEFIIKELAGYDGETLFHKIFEPPYPFSYLPKKVQISSQWLTRNFHKLSWDIGVTPYTSIGDIFRELTSSYFTICVKGREKSTFIQEILNSTIVDLPEQPPLKLLETKCLYHINQFCMCSVTNVIELYNLFFLAIKRQYEYNFSFLKPQLINIISMFFIQYW